MKKEKWPISEKAELDPKSADFLSILAAKAPIIIWALEGKKKMTLDTTQQLC